MPRALNPDLPLPLPITQAVYTCTIYTLDVDEYLRERKSSHNTQRKTTAQIPAFVKKKNSSIRILYFLLAMLPLVFEELLKSFSTEPPFRQYTLFFPVNISTAEHCYSLLYNPKELALPDEIAKKPLKVASPDYLFKDIEVAECRGFFDLAKKRFTTTVMVISITLFVLGLSS